MYYSPFKHSVMISDRNIFFGDVVLDSVKMAFMDINNILKDYTKSKYV